MRSPGRAEADREQVRQKRAGWADGRGAGERAPGKGQQGCTIAEWVSLGISSVILVGPLALLSYLHFSGRDTPPEVEVQPRFEAVRSAGGRYYVPIGVSNRGGQTAEDVRVKVSLRTEPGQDGQGEPAEVAVQFLAGHATHQAAVAFSRDPSSGQLVVEAISYSKP